MRTFVALELPAATRAWIGGLMDSLRPQVPGLRFIAPETVHLTLRFLGEASETQVAALGRPLSAAAARCDVQPVRIAGLGLFPDRGQPRVLWLGLELPPALVALQGACEEAAVSCGFPRERRPFRSHVTLGRWRGPARRPELPPVDLGTISLESLVLFQSRLHPKGAVHAPLAAFPLGPPTGGASRALR